MKKEIQELSQNAVLHSFFDFGKDAYSTLEIEIDTPFAENLEIIVGEVAKDSKIIHTGGFRTFIQNIIQTGIGKQIIKFHIPGYYPAWAGSPYCPAPEETDGEIAPFRYVEVNRHYGKVIVRRTAYFDDMDENASYFSCDNLILNQVWDFCKYSIKAASVFDKYVDGERERLPYEGDALINQLGHFCCGANYKKAQRTIEHFFEFGDKTWPTEWLLLTPQLVWDYYLYSGDDSSVKKWIPELNKKLLLDHMDENGLLSAKKYKFDHPESPVRDLIDWPETEQDGYETGEVNFLPNAYLYRMLQIMHALTDNLRYDILAERLKNSIRQHFLKNGLFVDSTGSNHTSLHSAIFALLFDLAEEDEIAVHKDIIRNKDMACSVYCSQFLLETCFKYGMADHAIKLMTSDSDRSWCNMLREGATITMESWGDKWKPNQDWNHAWGAAPANIVTRCLCGIRPLEPGFKTFIVDPRPGTISEFSIRQMTIHGPINLKWNKQEVLLDVPQDTVAVYCGKILPPGKHVL